MVADQKLSEDTIRAIAKLEHQMDTGEVQYVVIDGNRTFVDDEIMTDLGLVCGQTIYGAIYCKILEKMIALCDAHIAADEASANSGEVK